MPLANWVWNETSPSAAGAAASSQAVQGAASYLPAGVAGPVDDYAALAIVAELVGATGGTLDVYIQQNPSGDGVTWFDLVHFAQLSAGHGAVTYESSVSLYSQATSPVVVGKNAAPALGAGTSLNGAFSDRLRLLMVAGASTTAGAPVKVTVCGQRPRTREVGGR